MSTKKFFYHTHVCIKFIRYFPQFFFTFSHIHIFVDFFESSLKNSDKPQTTRSNTHSLTRQVGTHVCPSVTPFPLHIRAQQLVLCLVFNFSIFFQFFYLFFLSNFFPPAFFFIFFSLLYTMFFACFAIECRQIKRDALSLEPVT